MKVMINVDENLCVGAGVCYGELPAVYESQNDGTSRIRPEIGGEGAIVEGELAQQVLDLVNDCPTAALIAEIIEE